MTSDREEGRGGVVQMSPDRGLLQHGDLTVHRPGQEDVVVDISDLDFEQMRFWLGLGLAVSSTIFIGSSFIIKKLALRGLASSGQTRAGAGGFGYLKQGLWWAGLITLGLGEAFNFAAYAMVAASLVTPLGALSVLVSAVLASKFLDEKLNLIGKIGCALCLLGSTIIVIHAPTEGEVDSLDQLSSMLLETGFLIYVSVVILTTFVLVTIYAPKYGATNVLVYVMICSLIGSLSVMSVKALGLGIRETISGQVNQLTGSLFWFFLLCVIVTVSIQMNYLNKALDVFETSLVTPIYYVFFTTFVLISSSILFKEWNSLMFQDMVGIICGFLIIIIAVFLLNAFSEFDVTFEILRKHWIRYKTQRIASRNRLEDMEASAAGGGNSSRDYLISPSSQSYYHTASQSTSAVAHQAKILGKKLRKTKKIKRTISGGSGQQQLPPVRPQIGSDSTDSDI